MAASKHPKDYTIDEVCVFMNAIGFGECAGAVRENTIDGRFLVTLGADDYADLGLTKIQGKKVIHNLDMQKEFAESGGLDRIKELEDENAKLKAQLANGGGAAAASQQRHPPQQHSQQQHAPAKGMVTGGAKGAVAGATLGAIGGAIAGNPRKGAKIGAAVGGTRGAVRGLLR